MCVGDMNAVPVKDGSIRFPEVGDTQFWAACQLSWSFYQSQGTEALLYENIPEVMFSLSHEDLYDFIPGPL